MKHIGLFEGIGGFSLAAEWMGWETIAWCEWNEFGQKVLRHHFPKAEGFGDITKTDFTKYANRIDILTGGFPCQPYSQAGKRKGKEDERHLWPEMLRTIREVQPRWVVGENVLGLLNWNGGLVFHEVQTDLEVEGYEVFPYVLPACSKNAPHRRDRVWFIAYRNGNGLHNGNSQYEINPGERRKYALNDIEQICSNGVASNANSIRREGGQSSSQERTQPINKQFERYDKLFRPDWKDFPTQSPVYNGNDGLPQGLDTTTISYGKWRAESIKAGGNAIVPQVAFEIFKAIELMEVEMLNVKPKNDMQCGVGKNNI